MQYVINVKMLNTYTSTIYKLINYITAINKTNNKKKQTNKHTHTEKRRCKNLKTI